MQTVVKENIIVPTLEHQEITCKFSTTTDNPVEELAFRNVLLNLVTERSAQILNPKTEEDMCN